MTTILPSRNTEWGYWGTIGRIENDLAADPAKAWDIASRRIAEVTTASPEGVRDFLNSRHGRHFADDVAGELWRGETPAGWGGASAARPAARPGSRRGCPT
jgi:hypothetical protein